MAHQHEHLKLVNYNKKLPMSTTGYIVFYKPEISMAFNQKEKNKNKTDMVYMFINTNKKNIRFPVLRCANVDDNTHIRLTARLLF